MKKEKLKVLVGMSGGVDSSVAAALLKKQGCDVRGLFLQMHDGTEKTSKDLRDVQAVCGILGIPLCVKDVRKRFKEEVVKYFLDSFAKGRTPNPCVFCNENFKFKILLEEAAEMKIEYAATGHYARIIPNSPNKISNKFQNKSFKLKTAKDENKDQSYFLYRLGQKELSRIIFPLGEYEKTAVRALAKEMGLVVSDKKESQDVCFLSGQTVEEFLGKNLKLKKGKIVNEAGETIGEHAGVALYTIGQRKGIHIGGTGPYYVAKKDLKKNQLLVSNNLKTLPLFSKFAILEKVNWISGAPEMPHRVLARSRYRNPLVYATIKKQESGIGGQERRNAVYTIEFEKPEKALASGQSVVFYSKNGSVIGGGIIK